jgi:hypothetical protein
MVVRNLDLFRVAVDPNKANPINVIDPNGVPALSLLLESFELVIWGRLQIGKLGCSMNHEQLAQGHAFKTAPSLIASSSVEDILGRLVPE